MATRDPSEPRSTPARQRDLSGAEAAVTRVRRLAWLLDSSIRLPGGFRIGVDGVLGLVPGVGDLLAALLSSFIVLEAVRLRAPGSVLLSMVGNVALELGIGLVPVIGDLFDFVFKANNRNARLLADYLELPAETRRRSRWQAGAALLALGLLLTGALALVISLMRLVAAAIFP